MMIVTPHFYLFFQININKDNDDPPCYFSYTRSPYAEAKMRMQWSEVDPRIRLWSVDQRLIQGSDSDLLIGGWSLASNFCFGIRASSIGELAGGVVTIFIYILLENK